MYWHTIDIYIDIVVDNGTHYRHRHIDIDEDKAKVIIPNGLNLIYVCLHMEFSMIAIKFNMIFFIS